MIPVALEKAILNGWADYRKISHAFGTFSEFKIPKNSTVIITDIKWFPFINLLRDAANKNLLKWRDLFKFSEYQLKIDGKKSTNYLHYRNQWQYKFTDLPIGTTGFNLDDFVDWNNVNKYFLPIQADPIIQDVYFVCEDYIKTTVSRNVFTANTITTFTTLQPEANEQPTPNGIQNMNVLNRVFMDSPSAQRMAYTPPNKNNIAVLTGFRNTETYKQDFDPVFSRIQDPSFAELSATINFIYNTTPLVEFGVVTINNTNFDKIKNS